MILVTQFRCHFHRARKMSESLTVSDIFLEAPPIYLFSIEDGWYETDMHFSSFRACRL